MSLQDRVYGSHKKLSSYSKKWGGYNHATRGIGFYNSASAKLLGHYNGSVMGGKSNILTEMAKK